MVLLYRCPGCHESSLLFPPEPGGKWHTCPSCRQTVAVHANLTKPLVMALCPCGGHILTPRADWPMPCPECGRTIQPVLGTHPLLETTP